MNKKRTGMFIALALLLAGLCSTAQAAVRTWVGNTDTNWGTAGNWTAAAFASGDSQVYNAAGTPGASLYNGLASGATVLAMTFNSNAAQSSFIFNGNAITLGGSIVQSAGATNNIIINLPMTMTATRTVSPRGTITLGGKISGAGGLTKGTGGGNLILTGANDFTGDLTFSSGDIVVSSDANMGAGANINHSQNAQLKTMATFATAKTITLNAAGANQDIVAASGTTLTLNSKITGGNGGANMRITGAGTVVYAAANDHGAGTTVTGNLKLSGAGTINNGSAKVTMNSGIIDLGGTAQTIGGFTTIGGNSFVSNGNLTVTSIVNSNFAGGILTVEANLHGAGATLGQYQGTTILNGINDFTGASVVASTGTLSKLVINGSTLSDITVGSRGTLGGSGTVHGVTMQAGSTLAAGNSPGTLTFTANALLEAGSTNIMEIYSASLYDVLKGSTSNTLTLAGVNEIDFTGWTGGAATNGTMFNLFQNWVSVNTNGATFTFLNLANAGLTQDQLRATGTGFTVIPEPATIGMLGLGALITMMIRRMRTV